MSGGITAGTGMAIMGGAILGGAYLSSQAAKGAAGTQADAARYAADQNAAATERQIALSEPYRTTGTAAMNRLAAMTEPGGEYYDPFSKTDFKQDPGYAFRLKEGMKTLNASAAARGGLISGNALRAATAYGQEMGSQEYTNAFNRYYTERANKMDPLKFLSGQGQAAAAGQAANIGAGATSNAALITGAANANAAGQVGAANAYTNAIGQGVSAYQTNQLINRFAPQQTVSFYGSSAPGTTGDFQPMSYGGNAVA
jgi:hypothetical protein